MAGFNLEKSIQNLKCVAFDFDGVFTDNRVFVSEDGKESVVCNRSDGLGLDLLRKIGIHTFIVSTEKNPVVQVRAKKLKIDCVHGCENKHQSLKDILERLDITLEQTAFVGNDTNDLTCLKAVGLPVAVADAYPQAIEVAKHVLKTRGGHGAVREFCELIYRIRS
jgi:3-deoxy-D-manno-octulosonate 8-phosphate phosphatase (KDO 8-P phosphatase)